MTAGVPPAPLPRSRELGAALALCVVAFGLWYVVFRVPIASFWLRIALASALLASASLAAMGPRRSRLFSARLSDAAAGLVAAPVLYGVFVLGKTVLAVILPGSGESIAAVYAPREGASLWAVAALLLLVTGPAEETFWRGLVQHALVERLGKLGGLIAASLLYALAHLCTLNAPLVLAALVAGIGFGALALLSGSLTAPVICHSLWATLIFVLFPLS